MLLQVVSAPVPRDAEDPGPELHRVALELLDPAEGTHEHVVGEGLPVVGAAGAHEAGERPFEPPDELFEAPWITGSGPGQPPAELVVDVLLLRCALAVVHATSPPGRRGGWAPPADDF